MAITAVLDLASQVVDYTIDPDSGGVTGVPTSFVLQGTLPIRINGGASADLSTSPDIISVNTFGAAAAGIVPLSGGGSTNFLRADGSWAVPAGSGGYTTIAEEGTSLTQRGLLNFTGGDITAVDNAGSSRTDVSIVRFGIANGGTVPASGGGTTTFLRADGSWATPPGGGGGGVTLQASYPGTADTGNAHVTGVFGAQGAVIAGSNKKSLNGGGTEPFYVKQSSPSRPPVIGSYYAGSPHPTLLFRSARGTEAAPSSTSSGDELADLRLDMYTIAPGFGQASFLVVAQDGSSNASRVPFSTQLRAIGGAASPNISYIHLNANSLAGVNTITPFSGWEIATSLGLKPTVLTSGTTNATDADAAFLMNATAGTATVNLTTAAGRTGRIVFVTRIDSIVANLVQVNPAGVEKINGVAGAKKLVRAGQFLILISDGANWWTLGESTFHDRITKATDVTVANTVAETNVGLADGAYMGTIADGAVIRAVASGKLSTTGTPTLRFRIRNASSEIVADSGAVTMPSGVTDASWQLEYAACQRSTAATNRIASARLMVAQAAGFGASMNTYNMMDVAIAVAAGITPDFFSVEWGTASASNTVTCQEYLVSSTPATAVL